MTTINKTVSRRTRDSYRVLHHRKERAIVASFCVGDYIEFREAGCRQRFTMAIDDAMRIAVRYKVEADRRAKREARRAA